MAFETGSLFSTSKILLNVDGSVFADSISSSRTFTPCRWKYDVVSNLGLLQWEKQTDASSSVAAAGVESITDAPRTI